MAQFPAPAIELGNPLNALASTVDILTAPLHFLLTQINDFLILFYEPVATHVPTPITVALPLTIPLRLAAVHVLYVFDSYGQSIWQLMTDLTSRTLDLASSQKDMVVVYLGDTHRDLAPLLRVAGKVLILIKETFALGSQTVDGGIDAVRFVFGIVSWVVGTVDRMRHLSLGGALVVLLVALWLVREMVMYAGRGR